MTSFDLRYVQLYAFPMQGFALLWLDRNYHYPYSRFASVEILKLLQHENPLFRSIEMRHFLKKCFKSCLFPFLRQKQFIQFKYVLN